MAGMGYVLDFIRLIHPYRPNCPKTIDFLWRLGGAAALLITRRVLGLFSSLYYYFFKKWLEWLDRLNMPNKTGHFLWVNHFLVGWAWLGRLAQPNKTATLCICGTIPLSSCKTGRAMQHSPCLWVA